MKNMKRKSVLIAIALLTITFITGCGPFGHKKGPGHFHRSFHGKKFSDRILKHLDKKVDKLNLTEKQQEKYQELRTKIQSELNGTKESRNVFVKKVQAEINNNNPDMEKIGAMIKKETVKIPNKINKHIDYFMEFYNVLDNEQKGRILEDMKKKINRFPTDK